MLESSPSLQQQAQLIRLVIFDVDGVLTDGRLYFGDDGQEYKAFYSKDGLGMKMLMKSGVEIGIITARSAPLVAHRMENLGIQHLYQGQGDKIPAFEEMVERLGITPQQVAYVGDDLIDLPVMNRVGLAIAVADAHHEVIRRAHWTTPHGGGLGGARDVCDLIMQAQGTLQAMVDGQLRGVTN
jgi:3-deoxy-D-manno-octulosonate 8-phosphate phosphatase (KDO 8-P phosphatase)